MEFALAALLCLASGFALVGMLCPRSSSPGSKLLTVSIAAPFGLAIFSVIFFLCRALGITHLLAVDLLVFAALIASFFLTRTRTTPAALVSPTAKLSLPPWLGRLLNVAFVASLVAALWAAVLRILAFPQGSGWDAFAIWNLHARFLFLGGPNHWRDGFTTLIPWSHPDYPPLLPASIAHFWSVLGNDTPAAPALIALVFSASTVALLFSSLSVLRGGTAAKLGGLALLTTPFFIEQGTSQYADVPLSFFFLATIVPLCVYDERAVDSPKSSSRLLVLAALAAGFGAWTKNEGSLFLCAVVVSRIHLKSSQPDRARIWPLLAVILPFIALLAYFKHLAPPGDLFADRASMLHKVLDPARYWAILKWYAKGFLRFGNWFPIPGTVLLVLLRLAAGANDPTQRAPGLRPAVIALVLTLAGYFAVYLVTPYDIYWHLRFSLTRLFLQLWPATIFVSLLAMPRIDALAIKSALN